VVRTPGHFLALPGRTYPRLHTVLGDQQRPILPKGKPLESSPWPIFNTQQQQRDQKKAFAMYLLNKPRATYHATGYDRSTTTCQEVIKCCNAENRFNHIHIYLGKYNIKKQINDTKPSQTFYTRHNFLSAPPSLDIMNPIHPFFPRLSTPPRKEVAVPRPLTPFK